MNKIYKNKYSIKEWKENRYIIVDNETGKTFDDAQGYGYKTKLNAYKALYYKLNKKKIDETKKLCDSWMKKNPEFCNRVYEASFYAIEDGEKLTPKIIEEIADEMNVKLPCSSKVFMKFL